MLKGNYLLAGLCSLKTKINYTLPKKLYHNESILLTGNLNQLTQHKVDSTNAMNNL